MVQASEEKLSFHLTMRKTTCECQLTFLTYLFNKYLSENSMPGTVLGTGDIIVNYYTKSLANVGYIL